ncbi:MAG: FmdB family zinc ribbon protein [Chloroflexota bacterium]
MPIYRYCCRKCGHKFELKQSFYDTSSVACPECRSDSQRVFMPVPIIFKGSGFYVTDHAPPSPETTEKKHPVLTKPQDKKETAVTKAD